MYFEGFLEYYLIVFGWLKFVKFNVKEYFYMYVNGDFYSDFLYVV